MVAGLGGVGGGIGGAIGNIAVLAGAAGEGGEDTINQIVRLWKKLQIPDYDMRELDPAELSLVAEMFPNVYESLVPDEVKTAQDSPELRQSMERGLVHLERVQSEGLPLAERLAAQDQQRRLGQESQRVQSGIMRNFQERGRAGGGMELQARMSGADRAAELARGFGSDLAQQASGNRYQAAQDVMAGAGAMRGQDINLSSRNSDTVNRFNEFVSQTMNQAGQYNAGAQERAQQYNVGTRQGIADTNDMNAQAMAMRNQDTKNALFNQEFQNRVQRMQGMTEALTAKSQAEYADQAAKAQSIRSIGSGVGQGVGGGIGLI